MDLRFYQKIEIFKIQNFNKIPSFTICLNFFSIFGILLSISPIQTCPKIMEFFVVISWKGLRFYQCFLENSKSSFQKNIDMWNILFFFKILRFTIFFFFIIIFDILFFNFVHLCLSKNSRNFYVFLFYGLEILLKNFGKSWNVFQKNIHIWNPKFFINSIVYYLFFYSFIILVMFFSYITYPNLSKILNIFVVLYCTDYRFYQRILENSWIFIKKMRYLKYKTFLEFCRLLFAFLIF